MSGELPAVLALDGGNSKTDLALVAADGSVLAAVRGPGIPGVAHLDATLTVLADLIGRATRATGREGSPVARHLCACVANADLPEEEEQLAGALRTRGWAVSTEVANDTFAVLRAGLPAPVPGPGRPSPDGRARHWGVAVTCGAGINCVGVAPDGRTTRFLALGQTSGDWGGGTGLGRAALWWAIRAEDGRGPQTALCDAVAAHFDVRAVSEVAVGIHLGTISEDALLELAPVLLAVAGTGDTVAAALVRRQAGEICAMALVAMRRLDLTGLATPLVLGGGLLAARDPLLTSGITEGIRPEAPRAIVRIVEDPPVIGAALRGLDHVGAPPDAERRLRAAFAGRTPA